MSKKVQSTGQAGFTIAELSIASGVFGVVLLLCVVALLQIGKTFYKGITSTHTQDTTRSIIDDISRPIQFSGNAPAPSTLTKRYSPAPNDLIHSLCIGDQRYSYAVDIQVNSSVANGHFYTDHVGNRRMQHALWRDTTNDPNCTPLDVRQSDPGTTTPPGTTSTNGQEMLGSGMRLSQFNVAQVGGSTDAYQVDVWVVFGDEDLIDRVALPGHILCKGTSGADQFCAVSELTTVVTRRLE